MPRRDLCREHKQEHPEQVLAVTDLVATLGGLLTLGVPHQGAEVDDLTIAEPGQGIEIGRASCRERV